MTNHVSTNPRPRYWGGLQDRSPHYPPLLRGLVNAAANLGNILGQLSFGYLGDTYGRRFVYGNELIIGMVGIVMCIALPNSIPTPNLKMAWIFCWRFVLGIGIGGDYPISAAIMAERAHLKRRGQMLGWIFSNQGWVSMSALSTPKLENAGRIRSKRFTYIDSTIRETSQAH